MLRRTWRWCTPGGAYAAARRAYVGDLVGAALGAAVVFISGCDCLCGDARETMLASCVNAINDRAALRFFRQPWFQMAPHLGASRRGRQDAGDLV